MNTVVEHRVDREQISSINNKISIANLSLTFGPVIALENVSLEIADAEIICLLGPSGCGKSTLLNVIAGFEQPGSGAVVVNGETVQSAGSDRAMVFQAPALFPWLTVKKNVLFGVPLRNRRKFDPIAQDLLTTVGLDGFEDHYPYQLSGGMCQRVAIARALVTKPDVLLMDEPFGALDAQTRLNMQDLLQQVWVARKPTIVFVTHDVEEAVLLADRIVVMSARPGRVTEDIPVPFPRPRTIDLLTDQEFNRIKKYAWQSLHTTAV